MSLPFYVTFLCYNVTGDELKQLPLGQAGASGGGCGLEVDVQVFHCHSFLWSFGEIPPCLFSPLSFLMLPCPAGPEESKQDVARCLDTRLTETSRQGAWASSRRLRIFVVLEKGLQLLLAMFSAELVQEHGQACSHERH